jgi:hypothetical protein
VTAANLFVCDRAAYLLTDSAIYDQETYCLTGLRRKVFACSERRFALCSNGSSWGAPFNDAIGAWMEDRESAEDARLSLPALVLQLAVDLKQIECEKRLPAIDHERHFNLFMAMWSEERRRAEGYVIGSRTPAPFAPPAQGLLGGCVYAIDRHVAPCWSRELPAFDPAEPETSGLALLEAQRASRDIRPAHPQGVHLVGGTAYLTRVSEAGVSTITLRQWPDEIGRPIDPLLERTGALSGDSWANPKESARTATGL